MNNFSPSTDTSVGTKRFTAQEVQLAYTLMAVEYMKTIKGLNPNHQLVDKAVKLKALGFTNSKEVGDAITSEEDLKVLKCYSSETKAQLFEAVDYICADEPNGLVGVTGLLFDADKLKRSINAALSMRAEANVVTRRYGLRQQVLYLMYYGEE